MYANAFDFELHQSNRFWCPLIYIALVVETEENWNVT